jgi:hypothetical protein
MTMDVVKSNKGDDEHTIKPQAVTPALDTSSWPLLLKNYDKRECQGPGSGQLACWNRPSPLIASEMGQIN